MFARGFGHALRGVFVLVATQRNARVHLLATSTIVALAVATKRTRAEWAILAAAIGLVWIAEAFNTALEFLANRISQSPDPLIRDAKDLSAASVLLASMTSIALGVCAFWRVPWW